MPQKKKKIELLGANNIVNTTLLQSYSVNIAPATCGAHLQCVYCVATAPSPKPGDNGIAVDGNHERGGMQELDKAENEENNAGEKGDGQYRGLCFVH